jgi:hypothetical protein
VVDAFGGCQDLDARMGLLNLVERIVRDMRSSEINQVLLQEGLVGRIAAFLQREDLEAAHVMSACELLMSFVGDRAAWRLADKCGARPALERYTGREGGHCAAGLRVDPWAWHMARGTVLLQDRRAVLLVSKQLHQVKKLAVRGVPPGPGLFSRDD